MAEQNSGLGLSAKDENTVIACADLLGRAGARGFEIGYIHDDVPTAEAGWYAHAQMKGARITCEADGPVQAAEGLARKILTGGKCRCGKLVSLDDDAAFAFHNTVMADGTRWTAAEAAAAGQCRWRLIGARWEAGCPEPADRKKASRG